MLQTVVAPSRPPDANRRANLPRTIAFYLPQYHPIPENDEWWGPGFTEWTNVTRSRPLFPWHYQPRLPRDLGFYDLRLGETRQAQAELAAAHGIDGFCYYHYWFAGKQLLDRPLREVVASQTPRLPFMICWANENWTRLWNGGDKQVLIAQRYDAADDRAHIQALLPILADDRYLTVGDRRVLAIYRAGHLADPRVTAEIWREEAERAGMPIMLCAFAAHLDEVFADSFDASIQFLPQRKFLGARMVPPKFQRGLRRLLSRPGPWLENYVYSYDTLVAEALAAVTPEYTEFPCVVTDWDNSPRRSNGGARILVGSTPDKYGTWLRRTLVRHQHSEFVFVNAWNEWAEGAHLEPDQRWGRGYLQAHRSAVADAKSEVELQRKSLFERQITDGGAR